MDLRNFIRDVPDFPKKGIVFKDITPLLNSQDAFKTATDMLCEPFYSKNISKIASVESRGFIFGSAMALKLNAGFVPIRKKGKLPYKTASEEYDLEYGSDIIEVHADAMEKGENVLLVDDVLATGGTAKASVQLIERFGCNVVGVAFLVELGFLNGREKIKDYKIHSLITYDK